MKRLSIKQIECRIEEYEERHPELPGSKHVGRWYDELTDQEKEEYYDYLYGKNRKFGFETVEGLERIMCDEEEFKKWLHHKCEKRERDPTKPLSKKEMEERAKWVSEQMKSAIEKRRGKKT